MSLFSTYANLLKWLGPWSNEAVRPENVTRTAITISPSRGDDRPFEAWVYGPRSRPPVGAYLLCPGIHPLGPSDPRLDRFAAVLGSSGLVVLAPFLPDFTALRIDPRVVGDLDRAFGALLALEARPPGVKPGIFSISFGSLPALRVAASPERRAQVGALIVFGGYADWGATVRFCLGAEGGAPDRVRDPLNQPVVLMNLIGDIRGAPADPTPLLEAWRRYIDATWGRPEMKVRERYVAVAEAIARDLPEPSRSLFRVGCGLDPGAIELCEAALSLQSSREKSAFLDPRPHLSGLLCPVHLCHGLDDDVIPHGQLEVLASALPRHLEVRTYLTGLYGHTGAASLPALVRRLPALLREGITLARILRTIVRCSRFEDRGRSGSR